MARYYCQLCVHLVIIICLSGNSVNQNISVLHTSTPDSQTSTSSGTTRTTGDNTASTLLPETTTILSTRSTGTSTKPTPSQGSTTTSDPSTEGTAKSTTETTGSSSTSESSTDASDDSAEIASKTTSDSKTATEHSTPATSSASTSSKATTSAPPFRTTSQVFEGLTDAQGISVIKIHGQKKRLSLADIANKQASTNRVTSTTTPQPTTPKPVKKMKPKKKKKRRPQKKQKKSTEAPPVKSKVTQTSENSTKPDPVTRKPGRKVDLTTAYPVSPDTTFQIHPVEADVKPVAYAAAAGDKKNEKKAGKKNKRNGKLQGKKGEPGPKGPKGAKGEPGDAASSSMPMQAASSAVLTEHFGPDKDVIVPFDLKLIDLADNYDNTTGVFICTIPGVYVVSLYLMSHPGAKVNARVFINSRPIAALWADDSKNSGFYPSSSIQTVSRLAFGDQVYVMLVDGGYGESWVHANYNAFSLFLLYEEVFF